MRCLVPAPSRVGRRHSAIQIRHRSECLLRDLNLGPRPLIIAVAVIMEMPGPDAHARDRAANATPHLPPFLHVQARAAPVVTNNRARVHREPKTVCQRKSRIACDRLSIRRSAFSPFPADRHPAQLNKFAPAEKFVSGKVACRMNSHARSFVARKIARALP